MQKLPPVPPVGKSVGKSVAKDLVEQALGVTVDAHAKECVLKHGYGYVLSVTQKPKSS